MTIEQFTDEAMTLSHRGETWRCHMHKRSPTDRATGQSTAVLLVPARAQSRLPSIMPAHRRNARRISFGKPLLQQRVSLAALRDICGRPHWRKRWAPRLRKVFDTAVFDLMLVARALDGVRAKAGKVTIELGEIDRGHMLRIVGKRWRVLIAGRLDRDAKPMPSLQTGSVSGGRDGG